MSVFFVIKPLTLKLATRRINVSPIPLSIVPTDLPNVCVTGPLAVFPKLYHILISSKFALAPLSLENGFIRQHATASTMFMPILEVALIELT